jgi:hypothetical protein
MKSSLSLAVVAAPKPFVGHTGIIQRNAIRSWRSLSDDITIVLAGSAEGLDSIAKEVSAVLLPDIAAGIDGPPRVDDLLNKARAATTTDFVAYINSDIILFPDWLNAVRHTASLIAGDFLIIGRRTDADIEHEIDWGNLVELKAIRSIARAKGRLAARVCKDYFVFPRTSFVDIPSFTLGRAFWDNWMVFNARHRRVPVVDITRVAMAVHQNHDYAHVAGGRLAAYLTSRGARENRRLAGGSRMISGAAASWQMDADGNIHQVRMPAALLFALDIHRFLGLTWNVSGLMSQSRS